MRRFSCFAMAALTLAIGMTAGYLAMQHDETVNGMQGIGGREAYRTQRREALERLRLKAESLADPDIRAAELDAIDRAIGEIDGRDVEELGAELKVKGVAK